MAGESIVIKVTSKDQWDALHLEHSEKAIIVDFTAGWCGPCRMIGPEFDKYSLEFPEAIFLKVDVDDNEVWRGGQKVGELVGASKAKLKALIESHAKL